MFLAKGARCEYSLTEQSHLVFFFSPSQFPKRSSHLDQHVFFFFPQALHIAFLSRLVKCYHSVVYEKRGGEKETHKHAHVPEAKQVSTRPDPTHCENTFIIRP